MRDQQPRATGRGRDQARASARASASARGRASARASASARAHASARAIRRAVSRSAVLLGLGLLVACGDEDADSPLQSMHNVEVWFTVDERPVPGQRRVGGAPLDGALRALVVGPTPEERADGADSWFSPETAGVIRRVQAVEGEVVVDFRDLPDLIPGASSSAGSEQLLASLDSTVFQFDWVESVEYRLEGSCEAFWEWLQRDCQVVRRD